MGLHSPWMNTSGARGFSGVGLVTASDLETRKSAQRFRLVGKVRRAIAASDGCRRMAVDGVGRPDFFKAQLLGVNECPDRAIIDPKPARGEFGDQTAQCEVAILDPLQQPRPVRARNRLQLVATHFARRNTAGPAPAPHPSNRSIHSDPKLRRRPMAGQFAPHHRRNPALAQRRYKPRATGTIA